MRRVEKLTIPGVRSDKPGQRDNGKTFVLTEMDAYRGQKWAAKAILTITRANPNMPEAVSVGGAGMAGLASLGVRALFALSYEALEPLFDEMLGQVQYQHRPDQPPQQLRLDDACQIEEPKTFLELYMALVELHLGFSMAALSSTLGSTPTVAA